MDQEQQEEVKTYLKRESDVFAKSIQELGCTKKVYHEISTVDTRPIKQAAYRMEWNFISKGT
ncbi:11541_t:CDS:2 [Acaulospora morrowiae]|uniref:11541_t:CDS:1 n=1 Tax=Acaulospora morrowiae TaxID=94023 RepID=A0A9N9FFX6_9GLOM|nr:11541_t:CDS:2 [Acaulospora morrowiae]